ncbi:calcium/sodium antiporter [Candidatus Thorarchaeota archaeon]|nr:MAG: calcium/sodium antiporter [Candidatus Thorarchaeota archaeon]
MMQMLDMFLNLGTFLVGLALLVKGSDYLIQSATDIAKQFNVSDLLIGLTIVAIGTSLPEVLASLVALFFGRADLAFSNVIGSSLANLTLIVGIGAIVAPLATNHIVLDRDTKIMILMFVLIAVMMLNPLAFGFISIIESIILLLFMIAYLSFLYWGRDECDTCYQFSIFVDFFIKMRFLTAIRGKAAPPPTSKQAQEARGKGSEEEEEPASLLKLKKELAIVVVSGIAVAIGAQWVVAGAEYISLNFGIGESVIGFTIISIGTSLPELSVSINSARHGFGRLLIGNVVGSNIINIAMGLGFAYIFTTATVQTFSAVLQLSLLLIVSIVFYYFIREDWRVTRVEGIILVMLYLVVQVILIGSIQAVII